MFYLEINALLLNLSISELFPADHYFMWLLFYIYSQMVAFF